MNTSHRIVLLVSSFVLNSAHAIGGIGSFGGGGGSRGLPLPVELHQELQSKNYWSISDVNRHAKPYFKPAERAESTAPTKQRPPLVLNSLRFRVDVEYADIFRTTQAQSSEFIARKFLRRNLRHLVPEAVIDFDAKRTLVMEPGVESHRAKGVCYFPERTSVTYAGPVAVQALSRTELALLVEAGSAPEVLHETVAYVGLDLKWWSVGKLAMVSQRRPIATVDSRDLAVAPGSVASAVSLILNPVDWANAVVDVREVIAQQREQAASNEMPLDLKRVDIKINVHLLNADLKTIAEYPLDPAVTERLVYEASDRTSIRHTCGRLFSAWTSSKSGF